MDNRIVIDPANLRDAARRHAETADYLRTVPSTHDAIQDSLDSLGPIFGELREPVNCWNSGGCVTTSRPTSTRRWRTTCTDRPRCGKSTKPRALDACTR